MQKISRGLVIHLLAAAIGAALLSAQQCREDCTSPETVCVCAVESDLEDAGTKAEVLLTRLGSPDPEPARFRASVEIGDLLQGTGEGAAVELTCPKGSTVRFSNAFRAVLLPPGQDNDCAFSLLSGSVNILTGESTEVRSGLVVMGSKRTNYSLAVARRGQRTGAEAWVYEGEAECQASPQGPVLNVGAGDKMLLGEGRWVRSVITPRDIDRDAHFYARMDMAKAQAMSGSVENPRAVYANLKTGYSRVLQRPSDTDARTQLAIQQVNLKLPKGALYQIRKAEEQRPTEPRQLAVIAVTKSMVYQEMGNTQKAKEHYEEAQRIDPEAVKSSTLKHHRFDDRFLRRPEIAPTLNFPMVVKAVARPPSVAPATRTTIIVQTTSRDGKPVSGAAVKVAAGGGYFPTRRTEVTGRTDSRGLFQTTWFCRPCAPAYVLSVEAAKEGYQSGAADVRVEIKQR